MDTASVDMTEEGESGQREYAGRGEDVTAVIVPTPIR